MEVVSADPNARLAEVGSRLDGVDTVRAVASMNELVVEGTTECDVVCVATSRGSEMLLPSGVVEVRREL